MTYAVIHMIVEHLKQQEDREARKTARVKSL